MASLSDDVNVAANLAAQARPRRFADVAGQAAIVGVLRNSVRTGRPPQQVLLCGPSGTGKTTLARVWAAALFCAEPHDGDACGECDSCVAVTRNSNHPDVIEVDAASHGGVDQVRSLAQTAAMSPLTAPYRIFVIDEAHGLSREGAQAFLRLLEEPPAHTLWVLATTDPQKLPIALRGRCLQLQVVTPSEEDLAANLRRVAAAAGWEVDDATLDAVLCSADLELGVRGTVNMLAKLRYALNSTDRPSRDVVMGVLGAADPADLRDLWEHVTSGRLSSAVEAATRLLTAVPPPVLRSQLIRAARRDIFTAAAMSDEQTAKAVRRARTLLDSDQDEAGLLVAIATATGLPAATSPARVDADSRPTVPEAPPAAPAATLSEPTDSQRTGTPKDPLPQENSSAADPPDARPVNDRPEEVDQSKDVDEQPAEPAAITADPGDPRPAADPDPFAYDHAALLRRARGKGSEQHPVPPNPAKPEPSERKAGERKPAKKGTGSPDARATDTPLHVLLSAVAKESAKAALLLRRATIHVHDQHITVESEATGPELATALALLEKVAQKTVRSSTAA